MLKKIIYVVFTLLVVTSLLFPLEEPSFMPEKSVISMNTRDYRDYLKNNPPLDRLYCSGDTCFFLVKDSKLPEIARSGLPFQKQNLRTPTASSPRDSVNGDYHSYLETESELYDLESQYPDLARVSTIGQSVEGRELYLVKISDNVTQNENEPKIFIVGCHHAREWISVEMPLLFARYLLEHYPNNPQVKRAVEGLQIYVLPILNPDGLEFSIRYYRMWRKNRQYNGDFSWGVDLNRNYGYKWGYDDMGSSAIPYNETYRGAGPFSEPETLALKTFLLENPPVGSISFHNFSQMILYPWGYTETLAPDDAEMRKIAKEMSELIFAVNGRSYSYGPGASTIYPTNGDSDDWYYAACGTFAYTIELPPLSFFNGGFITAQEEIDRTFAENLPALLYFVNYFVTGEGGDTIQKTGPVKSHPTPGRSKK
jgi:murein tripeptide amidase MpaA